MTVYLIPGWGADGRMYFAQTEALPYNFKILEWIEPTLDESIQSYAKRLAAPINPNEPFALVGMSFGGIMSIEIAKFVAPQKHIIIASIKSKHELAGRVKLMRWLPVHQLLNNQTHKWTEKIAKHFIKLFIHNNRSIFFSDMYNKSNPYFLRWGIHQIANWQNESYPANLIHLHGTKDRTFPIHPIRNAIVVEGGTHFMNMDRKKEINEILDLYLGGLAQRGQ